MTQYWRPATSRLPIIKPIKYLFGFPILLIVLIVSCKNTDSNIGLNLRSDNGEIYSAETDTFTVIAYTVKEDSIKTDSLSSNILGAMYDPEFGISTASIASQVTINQADISFGPTPKIDSAIIYLRWDKNYYYGNLASTQYMNVYYANEDILDEKKYFSNYGAAIGAEVGNWKGSFNYTDSIKLKEGKLIAKKAPGIVIKLSKKVGEDLANANPTVYNSTESFKKFFKGLVFVPQMGGLNPGEGAISGVDFFSGNSKLVVYYNDSLQQSFLFNNNCENFNLYNRKHLNADLLNQLKNPHKHYDRTYVQSMGGCKTKIEIPHILNLNKNLNNERIVINEAALVLTPENGTVSTKYFLPSRLYLFQPDVTTGQNSVILDLADYLNASISVYTNYGGAFNSLTGEYTIRFTRHLQYLLDKNLINGENLNRGFFVTIPSDKPITPTRMVLNNTRLPQTKYLKLRLTYTKIKT